MKTKLYLLGIAILIKFTLFLALNYSSIFNEDPLVLYNLGGDASDYYESLDNLIDKGSYYFDDFNYSGRMPGMGLVYLPFRYFFSKHIALNIFIVVQTIISALVCLYIYLIFRLLFNNKALAQLGFLCFTICSYLSIYNNLFLTESLASSFTIISIYHILKFNKNENKYNLFYAGLFLSFSIFLRPFLILLVPIFAIGLIRNKRPKKIKAVHCLIFLSSFIIFDSIWISRNYTINKKIIPLQSTIYKGLKFNYLMSSYFDFIKSFGGEYVVWQNGAALWFESDKFAKKNGLKRSRFEEVFPSELKKQIDKKKMEKIRKLFLSLDYDNNPKTAVLYPKNISENVFKNTELEDKLSSFFDSEKQKYIENNPFHFYFVSRLRILKRFIFQPYTYLHPNSFQASIFFMKAYKILDYLICFLTVIFGLLNMLIGLFGNWKNISFKIVSISTLTFILLFPIIFRSNEFRYFTSCFPFLFISSFILIDNLLKLRLKKHNFMLTFK